MNPGKQKEKVLKKVQEASTMLIMTTISNLKKQKEKVPKKVQQATTMWTMNPGKKSTGRIESYYVDSIDTVGADNADYYYYEDEYTEDENHVRSEIVLSAYPPFLKDS